VVNSIMYASGPQCGIPAVNTSVGLII